MSDKPKILVTGANGQLGKDIRDLSSSYTGFEFVFLSREDMPINQFELVRTFFEALKPAYCINCAAYTAVDRAETEKELAFLINGEAVGVLAAICKQHNTKFIHVSTDYVFNGEATYPYTENFPTDPINAYGASKLEGEKQAVQLNPDCIVIRTSWVYSSHGKNFVKTIMRLMNEMSTISVVNDQVGSPTYAADLGEAILKIISDNRWVPGIYNYSNEGIISWYDFAFAIREILNSSCELKPISSSEYPTPAKRPAYSVFDKTKIQETFAIQLKNWKESLAICIEKIKKQ